MSDLQVLLYALQKLASAESFEDDMSLAYVADTVNDYTNRQIDEVELLDRLRKWCEVEKGNLS